MRACTRSWEPVTLPDGGEPRRASPPDGYHPTRMLPQVYGHEVSRFWFLLSLHMFCAVFLVYTIDWAPLITTREMWYYVPEAIFTFMILARCLISVVGTAQQRPGCDCFRAAALYTESGRPPSPALPLISRLPAYLGRMHGFLLIGYPIMGLVFYWNFGCTKFRGDHLALLWICSFIFWSLQSSHWICRVYFRDLMLILRQRIDSIEQEMMSAMPEHVWPERPPVDISPYMTPITAAMCQQMPECPVCTDPFVEGESVAFLTCNHFFHGVCAATWLRRAPSCPVCRRHVTVEPLSAEAG